MEEQVQQPLEAPFSALAALDHSELAWHFGMVIPGCMSCSDWLCEGSVGSPGN